MAGRQAVGVAGTMGATGKKESHTLGKGKEGRMGVVG